MTATIVHAALLVFLVVVFPIWDRHETRRLKTSTDPLVRIRAYQVTIAWQAVAAALLLATVPARLLFTPPAEAARMGIGPSPAVAIPLLAGLLGGAVLPVLLARANPAARERARKQMESIAFVLPRTRAERLWFAALSLAVGVCEEIIFRGWLIRWLAEGPLHLGLIAGGVLAAAVFGLDHGYQGIAGMLGTALLALVMTALFLATGTLWVPIALHALIDLRALLLLPPPRPDPAAPGS
ncbi:MAG TPA: CPBP family intramembrane glutamic endopeptidase [Longimicrobium sp.]